MPTEITESGKNATVPAARRGRCLLWALAAVAGGILLCAGSFAGLNTLLGGPQTEIVDRLAVTAPLCGTWTTQTILNSGRDRAVSARAAGDVWVGGAEIDHWDGTRWTTFAIPGVQPGGGASFLTDILALGPDDVWALGARSFTDPTFVLHYDGTSWRVVPGPSPDAVNYRFARLAATGPRDLWAVGQHVIARDVQADPVLAHWDGSTWHLQEFPGLGQSRQGSTYLANLVAVVAPAPDDAWAVGVNGDRAALLLHWDGHTWRSVAFPLPGVLWTLAGSGPADVWAGGAATDAAGNPMGALLAHWDGATWHAAALPGGAGLQITAVGERARADAWAVGTLPGADGVPRPLALHWDGAAWRAVPAPAPAQGDSGSFDALALTPAGTLWAAGAAQTSGLFAHSHRVVARFDGTPCGTGQAPARP